MSWMTYDSIGPFHFSSMVGGRAASEVVNNVAVRFAQTHYSVTLR